MNGLNIPKSMKDRAAWVCWQRIERDGKPTKTPINPHTGGQAMSNNPATWGTYLKAVSRMAKDGLDGIGFMFGDGFVGVDIDHCVDTETGAFSEDAIGIRNLLDSYTEMSPSGTGMHIIVKGALPPGGRRNAKLGIEMYAEERFFTVTGDRIHGVEVQERTAELEQLHKQYMRQARQDPPPPPPSPAGDGQPDEDAVIERIRKSKQGALFDQLWHGNWNGVYGSQSEADLALCNILAFWFKRDIGAVDRMFRRSGLMREKWNEARYSEQTLAMAVADTPDKQVQRQHDDWIPGPDEDPSEAAPEEEEKPAGHIVPVRYAHEAVPADAAYFNLFTQGKRYTPDDTGNAQRMFDLYGENARYCHYHKRWYIWNGKLWKEDVDGGIKRLADQTINAMYSEVAKLEEEGARSSLEKQIKRVRGSTGKKQMIEEMQHLAPVLPEEMDADDHLLNVLNGVIDLDTGELSPHSRARFMTRICPVAYDESAAPPRRWIAFIEEIIPDDEVRRFVQKAIGYSLTGSNVEQCIFVMFGTGGNGKGVFISVMRSMFGGYLANAQAESVMNRDRAGNGASSDLARLKGSRFVTCPESEEGRRISESLVKQLTGNDSLTVRFLFGSEFEYIPSFKIWLATNHKPVVKGTDDGFWRRMRLIPFTVTIPEEKKDLHLDTKLKEELPGILNWAIEGHRLWKAEGLRASTAIRAATEEYRTEMDIIAAFLDECTKADPVAHAQAIDLYDAYKGWCVTNNERPLTSTKFGRKLAEHGVEKKRTQDGIKYLGIFLLQRARTYQYRGKNTQNTQDTPVDGEDMPF